ncbi:TonB-dependent receptor plug domain-containing protein [Marinobacter salexigens]|uniref:TonB-dependent receptor plug domain-containing protein n=1 Tax=Marinobacter salexigens TaxID=1925763 RepID=UPI000C2885CA|nr:TonB-dependent receptor [Marinobacter salexigens]
MLSLFSVALLGLSAVEPAAAGATQQLSYYLDEIVVTGTRSNRTLSDTPVRTELVTERELEKTHARNVAEAIENVAGVQLRNIHGKSGKEVWLQGVGADRVLVLVDGLPLTATTGSSVDVSQLALLDVKRIEVVKGAGSAQYGSAAIGGVVNVITRDLEPGYRGEVTLDGGSYGEQNPSGDRADFGRYGARANIDMGSDQLRLRLSGSHQKSNGIDPEPATWARPGDETDRSQLNTRLLWLPNDSHRLFAELGYFDEASSSRFLNEKAGTVLKQGKEETVERWRTVLGGEHVVSDAQTLFWNLLREDLTDNTYKYSAFGEFDRRNADQVLSQASVHNEVAVGEAHLLMLGADFRHESLEQTIDGQAELLGGERTRNSKEIWFQDTWVPTQRWEWVAGLRGQQDSDFGDHYAPKINTRYELTPDSDAHQYLRASWSGGYRVPNLKERHYRFDHSQLGYVVEGNPDLSPETSQNLQLGWGVNYLNAGWLEINAFQNLIDDLIQTQFDADATAARGDGVDVYRYANVDKARTRGVETTAGWQFAPGWEVSAGYTFTQAEDRTTGFELPDRPRHQARLGLDGPAGIPGLNWSVRVRNQSSEYVDTDETKKSPGYTTVDLKLNQTLGDNLRLFAGVDNLTDTQRDFNDADDFGPVAGRFVYMGVTLGFGK